MQGIEKTPEELEFAKKIEEILHKWKVHYKRLNFLPDDDYPYPDYLCIIRGRAFALELANYHPNEKGELPVMNEKALHSIRSSQGGYLEIKYGEEGKLEALLKILHNAFYNEEPFSKALRKQIHYMRLKAAGKLKPKEHHSKKEENKTSDLKAKFPAKPKPERKAVVIEKKKTFAPKPFTVTNENSLFPMNNGSEVTHTSGKLTLSLKK